MIQRHEPTPESFWKTIWRDPRVRAVLGLALLVRLLFLGYLAMYPAGIYAKADSKDYLQLAQNLLYYHAFGRGELSPAGIHKFVPPPTDEAGKVVLIPETLRTPIYPAFLAIIYGASGSPFAAVIVQSLISLLTVWLIILLMARLFSPGVGWLAGLLAALEPLGLIYTHELMTESLFLLFVLIGVYCYIIIVTLETPQSTNLFWAALGGLGIGLATLTRPVGIYFPFYLLAMWIIGAFFAVWQRLREKAAPVKPDINLPLPSRFGPGIKSVMVFMVVAFLLPGLWSVRNYHIFGRVLVSSAADHNLLMTITSHMVAKIRDPEGKISSWQMFGKLEEELLAQMAKEGIKNPSQPERARYFRDWSLGVIKDHPVLFIWYYSKGMAMLFIPDIPGFYELLGFTKESRGAMGAVFRQGLLPALNRYFGEHWLFWVGASLPLILYDLGVYGMALWGVAVLWRSRESYLLFIILSIMGYWLAIAAVGAHPRYRLPAMPFLILLATWGLVNLRSRSPSRTRD